MFRPWDRMYLERTAENEKDLLIKVAEHASKEHGMKELTEVIRNK